MSFHTLTVTKRIPGVEFGFIKERMYRLCKNKKKKFYQIPTKEIDLMGYPVDKVVMFNTISQSDLYVEKGLQIKFIAFSEGNLSFQSPLFFGIRITVNPARLFKENDFISITTSKDVERFFREINRLLKKISWNFPNFEEFSVNRIDYSFNCNLGDQEKVSKYLSLISKGALPSKYNKNKYNNNNGYKVENKTVAIAVYNKMAQMLDQKHYFKDYEIIEKAKGILRFEIQVEYAKAYTIMKNNNYQNIEEFLYNTDVIAASLFRKYLQLFVYKGDYYSFNLAKQKVLESKEIKSTKELMVNFLFLATKCKTVCSVIKSLQKSFGYSEGQIKYCLQWFNEIGVNPVTIPRRYNEEVLLNPLKLINIGESNDN